MKFFKILFACFFFLTQKPILGQVSIADSSINLGYFSINYGGYLPDYDFKKLYGYASIIGLEGGFKSKSNFTMACNVGFVFMDKVKIDPHYNIRSSGGYVIDKNGELSPTPTSGRGFAIQGRFGKIFPNLIFAKNNDNSGIYLELGIQYIQYQIFSTISENVAPLNKTYRKGYDHLTSGIGVIQSLGYKFYHSNRFLNFFVAIDFSQNFTYNQRKFNYDSMEFDTKRHFDMLNGFRAGIIIPIYKRAPNKVYYN